MPLRESLPLPGAGSGRDMLSHMSLGLRMLAVFLCVSLKCRRSQGGSSSPFRHRSAVLRPMAAAPMAQLARPGRLHVQAGRGGHCWVIVSRLKTVFWPTQKIL